jgi:hypothetical protein
MNCRCVDLRHFPGRPSGIVRDHNFPLQLIEGGMERPRCARFVRVEQNLPAWALKGRNLRPSASSCLDQPRSQECGSGGHLQCFCCIHWMPVQFVTPLRCVKISLPKRMNSAASKMGSNSVVARSPGRSLPSSKLSLGDVKLIVHMRLGSSGLIGTFTEVLLD